MVRMKSQTDLLEVVGTLCLRCGFSELLHGGKQKSKQEDNNRNDNQKLDQRKGTAQTPRLRWEEGMVRSPLSLLQTSQFPQGIIPIAAVNQNL